MPGHELTQIAIVAVAALLCGLALTRLKQPAIVGYILAGLLLGPSGLGLVQDRAIISQLAELGVLMLLFLIGMELSLRGFRRVFKIALAAAAMQILVAVGVMLLVGMGFGWPPEFAILLGFATALSSTAVAIKILNNIGELRTDVGRIAIGVLIAQDLAVIPMLLAVEMLQDPEAVNLYMLIRIIGAVVFLVLLIIYLSRRQRVSLPLGNWLTSDEDLTALTAFTLCFAAAAISGILGLSAAYGAFLAGLVIGNTAERAPMINATQPVQSILLMAFFLSIGLLIDVRFIWDNLGTVLLLLALVTVVKSALNIGILKLVGEPWPRAFLAGTVLGQIGEFSFVLLAAGAAAGLVDEGNNRLMVSLIALSLVTSPLWQATARRLQGLAWRQITGFRELFDAMYGREADVVVSVSGRAWRYGHAAARLAANRAQQAYRQIRRQAPPPPPSPPALTDRNQEDTVITDPAPEEDKGA